MYIPQSNPDDAPGIQTVCWKKGHGNSQGLAVETTQRRSHLSKPPGTAYDRGNTGADCGHAPSHQSVAESLGAQSRERAAAQSGLSKKKVSRRGLSSMSRLLCRSWACTYRCVVATTRGYERSHSSLQQAIHTDRTQHPDDDFPLLHHREQTLRRRFKSLFVAPSLGIETLTAFDTHEHPLQTLLAEGITVQR